MRTPDDESARIVEATIKYVVPGEKAIFYPGQRERSYWPVDEHRMNIESMRPRMHELSLEGNGFTLIRQETALQDCHDEKQIQRIYYPEIEELVTKLTAAEKVLVFGHVVRCDDDNIADGALPAYGAHVDYGDFTVRQFVKDLLNEKEAELWLEKRYVLINLWRPVSTVYRTPLALCDASTVLRDDLNDSEIRGGLLDQDRPPLYGFNLAYNPEHRWYYVPQMQADEILAFKLFDSDQGRVQWTGHTAFDDPAAPADAPARKSLEIRTISFLPS